MIDYPSPLVQVQPPGISGGRTVWIPREEVFRVHNIFEKHEYAVPPHYLPSGSLTIVDIGANVGLFALYMKSIRTDCDVYCFEPAPHILKLLEKNIRSHQRIKAFANALSDHDGVAELYLNPFNSGENSLKSEGAQGGQSIQVDVRDAATVFRQIGLTYIDILKIDTEGSEVEILRSLHQYLPYVGIVMAEYHSETDRRAIDTMLPNHMLFDAKPCAINLGLVKYINSRLVESTK